MLKYYSLSPPNLFFFKFVLSIQVSLNFYITLRSVLPVYTLTNTHTPFWIFGWDCIETMVDLGIIDVLKILRLPTYKRGECYI